MRIRNNNPEGSFPSTPSTPEPLEETSERIGWAAKSLQDLFQDPYYLRLSPEHQRAALNLMTRIFKIDDRLAEIEKKSKPGGFTLIESLITLTIASLMVLLGFTNLV